MWTPGSRVLPGVVNEPFAITAGVNDALLFTFDGDGGPQVSVTLSAGAARTGAEVAAEIEAAFEAAGAPATAQAVSFGQQWIESTHPIDGRGHRLRHARLRLVPEDALVGDGHPHGPPWRGWRRRAIGN